MRGRGRANGDRTMTAVEVEEAPVDEVAVGGPTAADRDTEAFEHQDWIERATAWVRECVPTATGAYVYERASPGRHLVRFETDADPVWLKSVYARTNEYEMTLALTQWEPERCIPAFAHRVDWRAWLSHHVRGRPLDPADGCNQWAEMVRTMAIVQAQSVDRLGSVLGSRCRDYRAHVLLQRLDWLVGVIARAMEEQPSCPPQRLAERELMEIAAHARSALVAAIASGVPDALTHTDWGPHNVIIEDAGGCRLMDWAGACVAPAPVSLAWLLVKCRKRWSGLLPCVPALTEAWDQPWSGVVSAPTVRAMRDLGPMLAMLVRACRDADLALEDPVTHGPRKAILRSVARLILIDGRRRSTPVR